MVTYRELITALDYFMTQVYHIIELVERGDLAYAYTSQQLNELHEKAERCDRKLAFLNSICEHRTKKGRNPLNEFASQKVIDTMNQIK